MISWLMLGWSSFGLECTGIGLSYIWIPNILFHVMDDYSTLVYVYVFPLDDVPSSASVATDWKIIIILS